MLSIIDAFDKLELLKLDATLSNEEKLQRLKIIANQVSSFSEGSHTVLYSGKIPPDGTSSGDVARLIGQNNTDIRAIFKTDAASFLDDLNVKTAIVEWCGGTSLDDLKDRTSRANLFLEGTDGLWGDLSERFARETTGKVQIVLGDFKVDRIFNIRELPQILAQINSGAISEFAGVSSETFAKLSSDTERINMLLINGFTQTELGGIKAGDWTKFLNLNDEILGKALGTLDDPTSVRLKELVSKYPISEETKKLLPKLGLVGVGLALLFTTFSAGAAALDGRTDDALHILEDFVAENAGSILAGEAAGIIAAVGLTLIGGTIGAPVAASVIIGAALAGGYFGGEKAKEWTYLFQDHTEEHNRDLAERLLKLIFGENYKTNLSNLAIPPSILDGNKLNVDCSFSREKIVDYAKDNIAWRYALRELNPFVVLDDSLYEKHNTDGSLDLYDPETETGTMTNLYLQDRAAMLTWKIRYDKENKIYSAEYKADEVDGNWDFVDIESGITLQIDGSGVTAYDHQIIFGTKENDVFSGSGDSDHLYGMAGDDVIDGGGEDDYLEGGLGNDTLSGDDGADKLLGGKGDDALNGGAGNDFLEGGGGDDTYRFFGNYGVDIITDRDGSGRILVDTKTVANAKQKAENIYQDDVSGQTIVKLNDGKNLVILQEDNANRIIVNAWSDAMNLGIVLDDTAPAVPEATLTGDFKKKIDYNDTPQTSDDTYVIEDNNYVKDGDEENALDLITGTNVDDVIDGGGGDDALSGKEGDDVIMGGAGGDIIQGGLGKDKLYGGAGDDAIYGSSDERLAKPTSIDFTKPVNGYPHPQATGLNWSKGYYVTLGDGVPEGWTDAPRNRLVDDKGNIIDGGIGNDFIAAGTGADYVHGGADNDYIFGMDKGDVLFGDGGNDLIYGDGDQPSENSTVWAAPENHGNDVIDGGSGNDYLIGQGGGDIIFGGTGNDHLWGDDDLMALPVDGNDFLFGGAGTDELVGGAGDDYLEGGAENDTIWGGSGNDIYFINVGDGVDTIYDNAGEKNIVRFGAGVDSSQIKLRLGSLMLDLGNGNAVHIGNFNQDDVFNSSSISSFEFADGRTLSNTELLARGFDLDGTAGNDTIYGTNTTDRINGMQGDDVLVGGAGNDTYILNMGDGKDGIIDPFGNNVIHFGEGITKESLQITHGGYLESTTGQRVQLTRIDYGTMGDTVDIREGVLGAIDHFEFADGTTMSWTEVMANSPALNIVGSERDDRIIGSGHNDTIFGDAGNDTVVGQAGDDALSGGDGNDAYVFNLGDGQDAVVDHVGNNIIRFGEGITRESLQILHGSYFDYNTGTLVQTSRIGYGAMGDAVVVQDGLLGAIDHFEFADGSTMTWAEALANYPALSISGSERDDHIIGTGHDDKLSGNDGNDTLTGQAGYDVLDGGDGDDTYVFNQGDGFDTLQETSGTDTVVFGSGLNQADMQVSVVHSMDGKTRLNLSFGSDTLSVIDGHLGSIETFRFADGTSLDRATLLAGQDGLTLDGSEQADVIFASNGNDTVRGQGDDDTLQGLDGNDILLGGNGNDRLDGGSGDDDLLGQNGDDTLNGGAGQDTYHLAFGIGHDTVHELAGETSLIRLGAGLQASDFLATKDGNDLTLNIAETDDKLTLTDYFSNASSWQIETSEGQQSLADFLATASTPSETGSVYEQAKSIFTREIERTYLSSLAAQGYQLEADGLYHRYSYRIDGYSSSASHDIDEGVVRTVTESDSSWIVVPGSSSEQVSHSYSSVLVPVIKSTLTNAGAAASQTSSSYFVPIGNYSGFQVPLGSWLVEVEDSTGRYLGSWVHPPHTGDLPGDQSGTIANFYETTSTTRYRYSLEELVAGNSDNQIVVGYGSSNPSMLDAGAGNDIIEGSGLLYGNTGDDQLTGADGNDILIGGEGADTLDGGEGADRYFLENEAPADLIVDHGETSRIPSQTHGEYSGWPGLFPTLASALDEVIFPDAVSPADLSFSWNDEVISWPERFYNGMGAGVSQPQVKSLTAVLTINWGNGYGVRIAMPHSDQVAGGIERFTFADGTSLTRDQILALAPTHDLDPQLGDNILSGSGNLAGLAGNDVISGSSGNDFLDGGDGNDQLIGGDGNDRLNGGRGADFLSGGAGNDTLGSGGFDNSSFGIGGLEFWGDGNTYQGGTGDDTLLGTVNSDTYLFDAGDGQDTISDYYHDHGGNFGNYMDVSYGGPAYFAEAGAPADFAEDTYSHAPYIFSTKPYVAKDVLRFGADVQSRDVKLVREGYDLLLVYSAEGDSIRLKGWYEDMPRSIARLEFADGTVWDGAHLGDFEGQLIIGSDQADALAGTELNDTFAGLAGDDLLSGSGGYDVYRFDQGDGHDIIVENSLETSGTGFGGDILFGGNILPENIQALRHDQDLVLANINGTDSVTVRDWFSDPNLIKMVRFADGTQWTTEALQELVAQNAMEIHGTSGDDLVLSGVGNDQLFGLAGNDTLQGGDGDDLLSGGAGADHLSGGNGSDTFVFNIGDGADVLEDFGLGGDLVTFGAGISADSLSFSNQNGELLIQLGASGDSLTLKNWFDGAVKTGQLSFADGTTLDAEEMTRRAMVIVEPPVDVVPTAGADYLQGGSVRDVIDAGAGDDRVDGSAGNDVLNGGEGNDTLLGGTGDDTLFGDGGDNILDGGAGNDVLQGGWGNDTVQGGIGDDVLYAGGGAYNVLDGGDGNDQLFGDWGDEVISGGSGDNTLRAGGGNNTITAGDGNDVISADWGNDTIDAGDGNNQISAGGGDNIIASGSGSDSIVADGNNRIVSGAGDDTVTTSWGTDFVNAGAGNDIVTSTSGNDILLGGDGNDSLSGGDGSNLLDGGAGADVLTGGSGAEVFIGGAGNDLITLAGGNDIVLYNQNDGQDTVVTGPWGSETLSLGGGISYDDLAFVKDGNNLQLKVGTDGQITFKDWYASSSNQAVVNLQVIADAMADFAPGGNDPLRDQKVEQFDFKGLVGAFDTALSGNSALSSWALTNALTSFQLAEADTAALGGDLAYQYGELGSLSGIGLTAGQQLLGSGQLGSGAQSLQAPTTLQQGAVRLG